MSNYMEVRLKHREVIEFLTAKGVAPIDIHSRISAVYGEVRVDRSIFRSWVSGNWKPSTTGLL